MHTILLCGPSSPSTHITGATRFPTPRCLPGCRRSAAAAAAEVRSSPAAGGGEAVLEHALGPQHVAAVSVLQEASAVQLQRENKANLLRGVYIPQKYYGRVKLRIGHKKVATGRRGGNAVLHSSEAE